MAKMKNAAVILYMIDLANDTSSEIATQLQFLQDQEVPYLVIGNKSDAAIPENLTAIPKNAIIISASQKENLENLKSSLKTLVSLEDFKSSNTIVTNLRHYESLTKTDEALDLVLVGINDQVTNDFVAMDIRQALHHLGEITGQITTDDLLANIFSKFCIGK